MVLKVLFFILKKSFICFITEDNGTSDKTPSEQIVTDGNVISLIGNPVVAILVTTGLSSHSLYRANALKKSIIKKGKYLHKILLTKRSL